MTDKNLEQRLRYALNKEGYSLHKSIKRIPTYNDAGGYMIVNYYINGVVAGPRFELDLDDVAEFVEEMQE